MDEQNVKSTTCAGCIHGGYCEGVARHNCLKAGRKDYHKDDSADRIAGRITDQMRDVLAGLFKEDKPAPHTCSCHGQGEDRLSRIESKLDQLIELVKREKEAGR